MKPTSRDGILRGGIAAAIRLLLLAAAAISGYLLSVSLSGGQAIGCSPGSSCDAVLQSRWAYVLGLPVSALALVVDLALLATTFSCGAKSSPRQRRGAWEILAPGAVLLLTAALWFTALQAFVLHRYCPWCLAAHACGALAAILLLTRLPVTDVREQRDKDPSVKLSKLVKFSAIALAAIAAVGLAQTFAPGKSYAVAVLPENGTSVATNAPGPTLNLHNGRIQIDLSQAPIWGSLSAPHKMVSLYDYTCSHCREMHERVVEVQREFSNQLAVISLPMPLDPQCNTNIMRRNPAHANACDYARLGLSVWRAKREALLPFDHWLFSFPKPPPLDAVTNKAVELIGKDAFARAISDPWINEQIKTSTELFHLNYLGSGRTIGSMPQFVLGTNLIAGPAALQDFRKIVASQVSGSR